MIESKKLVPPTEPKIINFNQSQINKPEALSNFYILPHIKSNINRYDENCNDIITKESCYCFDCMKSVCQKCGIESHQSHYLIQRDLYLNYNNKFFDDIANEIEDGINIESQKDYICKSLEESINKIKNSLDIIKNEKFKEINKIFKNIKNKMMEIKVN